MIVTTEWMEENYAKFNELAFGGQLPNIKMVINNRLSRAWGRAMYRISLNYGTITPLRIEMVSKRDCPEEVLRNILVHEMIHVLDYSSHPEHFLVKNYWRYTKNKGYDAHGSWFKGECNRINSMNLGVTVTAQIQSWESNASKLSDKAQAALDKRTAMKNQEGAIIGLLRKPNGKQPWFFIKTNNIGRKSYERKLLKDRDWYAHYTPYIEWYRSFNPKYMAYRNETGRGWYYSNEQKNAFVNEPETEYLSTTTISYDFTENKNMDYSKIIQEAINDFVAKETNETIVTGEPGQREYFKQINDDTIIGAIE